MPSVVFEYKQGAFNTTITTNYSNFSMTKVSGAFPSTPYRITGAQMLFTHIRIDAQLRGMEAYCNNPGVEARLFITTAFRNHGLMAEGNYYDVVFGCGTALNYEALNVINLRSTKASSSSDGAVCSVRSQSVIRLTVTYELTTTACTPLTTLSVNSTLSEGNVTLTGSGAGGGVGNSITGYEVQYRDSADGASYGGWTAYTTAVTTAESFAVSVAPSGGRGYYRQYRAQTVGSAGADYASGWKQSANTVRRYGLSGISLNKSAVDAGAAISANIAPMAANLTHRVTWRFGKRSQVIDLAAGVTSSAFTVPMAWLDVIPQALSGSATCVVETLLSGAVLGSTSAGFTITCPNSVAPTIGRLTVAPVNEATIAPWGLYLKGQSKTAVTMENVAGGTGSTIVSQTIACTDYSGSGPSFTTGVINRVGDVEFTATVTDGRGKTAKATVTAEFKEYQVPKITSIRAYRADEQGVESNNGTRIAGRVTYSYQKVGLNEAKVWVYVNNTVVVSAAPLDASSATYSYNLTGPYAITTSHTVRVEIRDTVNAVAATAEAVVSSAARIMNIGSGTNAGVAFGKMSEKGKTIELAADWDLVLNALVFSRIYPVGCIYTSVSSVNPSTLFGGTWVAWGAGRVPVGVGTNGSTNYPGAEQMGGTEIHSHSVNPHTHSINDHQHYVPDHVHTTGSLALSIAQIPSHTHDPNKNFWGEGVNDWDSTYTGGTKLGYQRFKAMAYVGGGQAHNHGNTGASNMYTGYATGMWTNASATLYTNTADGRVPYVTCYMWKRTA